MSVDPASAKHSADHGGATYFFCSARCRDVDLGRWFGEAYRVPAVEPGYDGDEDGKPVKQ